MVMSQVKHIKPEFSCWYMDDGTPGGDINTLLKDFNLIIDEGKTAKCEIITDEENVVQKFKHAAHII
jgi:hypothetical protein